MNRYVAFACTLIVAVLLDQSSKSWVDASIAIGERIELVSNFLFVTHVRNPGAAFGLFAGFSHSVRLVGFLAVLSLATLIVVLMLRALERGAPGELRTACALALVQAGAIGNALDRVLRGGSVVDFIQVRPWDATRWPDFNLADVFIVLGVASLLIDLLASEQKSGVPSE